MNIFHSILQKLGFEKPAAPAPTGTNLGASASVTVGPPKPAVAAPVAAVPAAPVAPVAPVVVKAEPVSPAPVAAPAPHAVAYSSMPNIPPSSTPAPVAPVPVQPVAVPLVDVVNKLEGLAKSRPELDWKVSIVDMLKLLEMDSSFEARKELAVELDCPEEFMGDSAKMNVWLHKTVLQKIAENGGNIPASLLD
jgi:hypothetical protein